MDFGLIHAIWTIVVLVVFIGIVAWAYGSKRKKRFEDDAMIPFNEEDDQRDNNGQ